MSIKEIPWDEFPEATHWSPETPQEHQAFWKIDSGGNALECWVVYQNGSWGTDHYINPYFTERNRERLIKRPEVFDEKNPPLNTQLMFLPLCCEFWKVGEVRYIGSHYVVIWNSGTREEQPYELGNVMFAPLKSEKDEALEEIASLIGKGIWQVEALRIWNAGYRKIKSGENE